MADLNFAPVCGIYCGDCNFLGKECPGCGDVDGKPFWTVLTKMEVCPLHDCCRNRKHLEHCGLCKDLPCQTFLDLRDPAMSDEEFNESLATRQKELALRAEIGTDTWLGKKNKEQ